MTIQEINLGSVGIAAMAYVSNITNHPSLCGFFLKAGVVGVIVAIIKSIMKERE